MSIADTWANVEDFTVRREGEDITLVLLDGDEVSRIKFPAGEWALIAQRIVLAL